MFEHISRETLQRAMKPPVQYGRGILGEALRRARAEHGAANCTILTQPQPWEAALRAGSIEPARDLEQTEVVYLRSLEASDLAEMESRLPETGLVMGLGGGQAMDAAKYVSWRRDLPLVLAPTIVSVDAAVTNTIATRERQRVRYGGLVVADAIPVDFAVIAQAPPELNRAGIGDLLSIHTALWDWRHAGNDYDQSVATEAEAILHGLYERVKAIRACDDAALHYIMDGYARENALCLQVGSSRPEEGSEHFLGYNLEYLTGRGYVHGQLICLCTYALARLQENAPGEIRQFVERSGCPWRLSELGIARADFVRALLTLRDYAAAENFLPSVITLREIGREFAEQVADECA